MSALAVIRALPWRIIGPAIGALALLWACYSWAHERGVRSRDREFATLATQRKAALANAATLEAAVARQNAAARLAEARGKAAQDMAAQAAREARERERALAGLRRRLEAAGRPVGDGCGVPAAVVDAWGAM